MDIFRDISLKGIYQAVKFERLIKKENEARKAGAVERMNERYKNAIRFLQDVKDAKEVKENAGECTRKNCGKDDG